METCIALGIDVVPLDKDDHKVPTQADGESPLQIVGQAKFTATRGKVVFFFEGYVAKQLNAQILCGGPFMEHNKLVQELHNKKVIIDGKHHIMENSPFCPNLIPEVSVRLVEDHKDNHFREVIEEPEVTNLDPEPDLKLIEIGPQVPKDIKDQLQAIHKSNKVVFDDNLQNGYNGLSGDFDVNFNFSGGVPPSPNYYSSPPYNLSKDDVLMQAKIDSLEDQGIVVKVADTDIVPSYAAPTMLALKNSAKKLPPGGYEKLTIKEKLKYNRFILCHNKLSEHIEKRPAKVNTLDETTRVVGGFEFVITSDLKDSFWQRHIAEEKLPYMAFHSPFRGTYIFLRSTQGLINQSEGLEEMLSVVLQDCIMSGWCTLLADNVYVLGHSYQDTVDRWKIVLKLMAANNLKLSPAKTACFPPKLDLLGWTKQGKMLVPDPHRQNRLAQAALPNTVEQLRSYLGGYRTFYRCKADMSVILRDLELFVASKKSSERLEWTDELKERFEESRSKIKDLDSVYLPKPDDQLVITSDWSMKGLSATLWAMVENDNPKVVARYSAKLPRSLEKMLEADPKPKTLPCDGEMSALYVALKSPTFSNHIRASSKRTVALVDSKPVVQAAGLLKNGKFSSSRVINNLMTAVSEHNLELQHISGKFGQNFPDDFSSRNPASCEGGSHCKICSFIEDCKLLTVGALAFTVTEDAIVGQVNQSSNNLIQDILTGVKTIPFNNRKAMAYLQDQDADLLKVKEYLRTTKRPTVRNTRENKIKRYLRRQNDITIAKDGVLVSRKRDKRLASRELVVVPDSVSMGLLYGLHLNLNHPTAFQLTKVVDTKFFILDRETKIKKVVEDCTLCQSVAKIPEEIHSFTPNKMPEHPGQAFTVDILRMAKKIIVIAVENFSGFVSAVFSHSEKQEDLLDGIISAVTPFKSISLANVRVDQAPAFKAIFKKPAELRDLNIELELGECKNKNALALVDKKMQEIEQEIKKFAPNKNKINVKILAKAVSVVNEKIRHQGLSAKEILFSRDQYTQENLNINDEEIAEEKMNIRKQENIYSAKSKASVPEQAKPAGASKGHLVFLKREGDKLERRDLYLVIDATESEISICKLPAALSGETSIQFQPHNIRYKVKQTEVFLAPNQPVLVEEQHHQVPVIPTHENLDEYSPTVVLERDDLQLDSPRPRSKRRTYPFEDNLAEEDDFDIVLEDDNDEEDTDSDGIKQNDEESDVQEIDAEEESSEDSDENGDNEENSSDDDTDRDSSAEDIDHDNPSTDSESSADNNEEAGSVTEQESAADEQDSDDENAAVEADSDSSQDTSALSDDLESNPVVLPNVGARIQFKDPTTNIAVKATVTRMHRTMQYQWPGWRNIQVDGDPRQSSVNLDLVSHGCVVWKYLGDTPRVPRAPGDGYVVPQIDGNYTLPSGPSVKDYDDSFSDSELGTERDGFTLHVRIAQPAVYFIPPTVSYEEYQAQQVLSPRRSRWQRFLDHFRSRV